ncbi:hypothetical protein ACFY7C_00950 [Streptomyces sp. NPDC012769]|uniref:hypothetical protein n=1 Tax=Streptomyces sp. NPDC012769 TaxID=3364848 RepID=UPI0036A8523C
MTAPGGAPPWGGVPPRTGLPAYGEERSPGLAVGALTGVRLRPERAQAIAAADTRFPHALGRRAPDALCPAHDFAPTASRRLRPGPCDTSRTPLRREDRSEGHHYRRRNRYRHRPADPTEGHAR